jgi:hypothetical protein
MQMGMRGTGKPIYYPQQLDSLFYWFKADEGVFDSLGNSIATDEGVGEWRDFSGNNYHVTQATNTARPVYKATGGPGSKPAIQFDGTNDFLASAAHWWGSDDLTVIVVMKHANATRDAVETFFARWQATNPRRQFALDGATTALSYVRRYIVAADGINGTVSTGTAKQATYEVISWTSAGSGTPTLHANGSAQSVSGATTTIVNGSDTKASVGALNIDTTPINFLQGSISEIIVYSRALSADERVGVEQYLKAKYGL